MVLSSTCPIDGDSSRRAAVLDPDAVDATDARLCCGCFGPKACFWLGLRPTPAEGEGKEGESGSGSGAGESERGVSGMDDSPDAADEDEWRVASEGSEESVELSLRACRSALPSASEPASAPPSPSPSPTGAPKRRGWSNKEEADEKSDEGGERDEGEDSDGEEVTEGTTGELVRRACFMFCLDVLAPAASCGTCDTLRLPPPGARFGTVFDRRRPLAADRGSDALAPTLSRGESGGGPAGAMNSEIDDCSSARPSSTLARGESIDVDRAPCAAPSAAWRAPRPDPSPGNVPLSALAGWPRIPALPRPSTPAPVPPCATSHLSPRISRSRRAASASSAPTRRSSSSFSRACRSVRLSR